MNVGEKGEKKDRGAATVRIYMKIRELGGDDFSGHFLARYRNSGVGLPQ